MKVYLISLAVGLLAGAVYGLLGVRSPAPPVVALVGLTGILIGEQAVPLLRHLHDWKATARFIKIDAKPAVLGIPNPPTPDEP